MTLKNVLTRRPDPLIVLIIVAVILAILLPARGDFAEGFSLATKVAIALLFFLYGARLSPTEALQGLNCCKLHSTTRSITYMGFPPLG